MVDAEDEGQRVSRPHFSLLDSPFCGSIPLCVPRSPLASPLQTINMPPTPVKAVLFDMVSPPVLLVLLISS